MVAIKYFEHFWKTWTRYSTVVKFNPQRIRLVDAIELTSQGIHCRGYSSCIQIFIIQRQHTRASMDKHVEQISLNFTKTSDSSALNIHSVTELVHNNQNKKLHEWSCQDTQDDRLSGLSIGILHL